MFSGVPQPTEEQQQPEERSGSRRVDISKRIQIVSGRCRGRMFGYHGSRSFRMVAVLGII